MNLCCESLLATFRGKRLGKLCSKAVSGMRLLLKRHISGVACACICFVQEVDSNPECTLIMNYKMRKQLELKFSNPYLCAQGVRNYSVPIGLDSRVLVDLVVVGSVAVSEKGWRIGKGEGYADLEYAMMVSMGAISKETPVVTIVHDCQVVDIPEELVEEHDITVDYILTPTRVIATGCKRPKPMGITWFKISREMMEKIPILRSLRAREQQAGKDVTLQGEHQHLSEPGRQQTVPLSVGRRPPDTPGSEANSVEAARGSPPGEGAPLAADVYVGNLPQDARVSDLKRALRELGSMPLRLTWQGPQRRAFLHYPDSATAQQAISCLQGLRLGTDTLRVALARQQRDK
ncbi:methenyltetrahydrofolate synthase domain-containing protein isoform X7 [Pongo abelii]|uniref:methenyltetrahydrofolate synthase domain-containing protein isoform X7 n=1 Tax=Pongo abelii TaxID=9601 RepID=UPI0023E8DE5A|nr:methenyltetrahydrofolate synthase domain-containing protein isoform X7 [Pongo abelii]